MKNIENLSDRHCPKKSWGWEEWIVNNDLYCGKKLHFYEAGGKTSLHFHMRKHETMYVQEGVFCITVIDQETVKPVFHYLQQGESLVIEPGTVHSIRAERDNSVLIEFSTHHEDSDSYRVSR